MYFGAGETPTPQENLVIVEQASCLFLRIIVEQARCLFLRIIVEQASCLFLRMVKEVRLINLVSNYIVALKYCKVQGVFKVCR